MFLETVIVDGFKGAEGTLPTAPPPPPKKKKLFLRITNHLRNQRPSLGSIHILACLFEGSRGDAPHRPPPPPPKKKKNCSLELLITYVIKGPVWGRSTYWLVFSRNLKSDDCSNVFGADGKIIHTTTKSVQ